MHQSIGVTTGPTDSSVEKKWFYSNTDGSSVGPQPLVDKSGNVYVTTTGGTMRSLSTTAATNPSPLFSGYQYSSAGGSSCLPLSLSSVSGGVFTFGSASNYYSSILVSGQRVHVASAGSCSGTTLSTTAIYFALPLTTTTFSLSTSSTTLSPIAITCTTFPTLVTLAPGPTLTASSAVILATGTYVVASIPCSPTPCTNTVGTATVLAGSTTATTSYTVSPMDTASLTPTGVATGNWSVANTLVANQPLWLSYNGSCTGGGSLLLSTTTVYYVLNATPSSFFLSASTGGVPIIFTACSAFPVVVPYTTSTGCLSTSGGAPTTSNTVAVSYTSTAPPTLNWVLTISGSTLTTNYGSTTSTLTLYNSMAGIPTTATPALDNTGTLWWPVGNNLLPINAATGSVSVTYQPACPVLTSTSTFFASVSGTTLTFNSLTTLTGYITLAATTPATGTLSISSTVPFLAPGSILSTPASSSTVIVVLAATSSSTSYTVSISPASALGSSASPVVFTAQLAPYTYVRATGLVTGAYIVSGSGTTYTLSVSATLANTTFSTITGLPTSPVLDSASNVVFTCGAYIALCSPTCTSYLWNQGYALLSPMAFSPTTSLYYASDSGSSLWAWSAAQLRTTQAQWTWPPIPWPSTYLARTTGLVAHFNAPVVGTSSGSGGAEQVYLTRFSPLTSSNPLVPCYVHAIQGSTSTSASASAYLSTALYFGGDAWTFGVTSGSIQAGMPLTPCIPSQPAVIAPDRIALVCTSTLTTSGTLNIVQGDSGAASAIAVSNFKFAASPLVDASLSTLYLTGADGCVTGYSTASYSSIWQMPAGCAAAASSTSPLVPMRTQPVMMGTIATSGTSSTGTPGYIVAQDTAGMITAYGRYGSATTTPSSTASISPSATLTASPTHTLSPTALRTTSPTHCASATVSASTSSTPSACTSASGSPAPSNCASITPTISPSFSSTPTTSHSLCLSSTPSTTGSPPVGGATVTSTSSLSPSLSASPSSTPSHSHTPSNHPSPSTATTLSFTLPPTLSAAPSLSPSTTSTSSSSASSSITPTGTPSFTPWRNAIANGGAGSAASSGSLSSADIASLTGAGIAMCVIGGLMVIGAIIATFYFNPPIRKMVFGQLFEGEEGGEGGGEGGKGGKGGKGDNNSNSSKGRGSNTAADGDDEDDGGGEGEEDGEESTSRYGRSGSGSASLRSQQPPTPYTSSYGEDAGGVMGGEDVLAGTARTTALSPRGGSSSSSSSSLGGTMGGGSSSGDWRGSTMRSSLKSSLRSTTPSNTAYGSGGGGGLEELDEVAAPSSSSRSLSSSRARSTSRSISTSSSSRRGEVAMDVAPGDEDEGGAAAPTSVRSPSATRRGSYSAKRSARGSNSQSGSMYQDWTRNAEDD